MHSGQILCTPFHLVWSKSGADTNINGVHQYKTCGVIKATACIQIFTGNHYANHLYITQPKHYSHHGVLA